MRISTVSNTSRQAAVHLSARRRTASTWVCPGYLAALLLGGVLAAPAAVLPPEKLLPADTLAVVSAPEFAKLRGVLTNSALSRCWHDPAMKPFREKFLARWNEEFIRPLERDLGVKLDDYLPLLQGQVTLALTQDGWDAKEHPDADPGLLLLLDARAQTDQLKTNLANLRKQWTDAGRAVRVEKIREVEFAVVTLSTNDVPKTLKSFAPPVQPVQELGREKQEKPAPDRLLLAGQFESLLIVANSTRLVDGVVARLTGGNAPALADDPAFEQNRLALFREAALFAWVNVKRIMDELLKLPRPQPNPQAPNPEPPPVLHDIIGGLGLGGLRSLAFTVRDTGDGLLSELFLHVPEASREGAFKLFAVEARDASPPPLVPADAVKFMRLRLPGEKSIATFEKMLKQVLPQNFESWQYLIKNGEEAMRQTQPGFDVRQQLFASLGDDFFTYEKAPRANSAAALDSPPSLYAFASPDPEKLLRALPALLVVRAGDALTPKVREFLGKRIYSVSLGAGGGPGERLSYAASAGYVIFSTEAATLEEFLRTAENPGRPLRDTAGLAEAAQRVGGMSTGMFSYENQAETMRLWFELWKRLAAETSAADGSSPAADGLPTTAAEKSMRDWLDFSLLPEFSKVAKYFSFSVWSGSATTEGLSFKWFSPTPPGAR